MSHYLRKSYNQQKHICRIRDIKVYDNLLERNYKVSTDNCGFLNVFVQGKISDIRENTAVFLTVHDLGSNHHEYCKFIMQPCMAKLRNRSVWIHVDLPGQENNSVDLQSEYNFPSLGKIASDLVDVLNYFGVKMVVTLGEGAGANILLRFALANPQRVLGNVLINCETSGEYKSKYFQRKLMSWKLASFGMNTSTNRYLVHHKFGMYVNSRVDFPVYEKPVYRYFEYLQNRMNLSNLRPYLNAYLRRSDLTNLLKKQLIVYTMLVSSVYPLLQQPTHEIQIRVHPHFITRMDIPCYGSVMLDSTEAFAHSLQLFCQGLGLFSTLPISRSESFNSDVSQAA